MFKDLFYDKWYTLMCLLLLFITIIDVLFTYAGLELGFSEGNPIMIFGFGLIGVKLTLLVVMILTFVLIYFCCKWRSKLYLEKEIRMVYFATCILILVRGGVVCIWFGMLHTYLGVC